MNFMFVFWTRKVHHCRWTYAAVAISFATPAALINWIICLSSLAHIAQLPPGSFLLVSLCSFEAMSSTILLIQNARTVHGLPLEVRKQDCIWEASLGMFVISESMWLCLGLTLFRYYTVVWQKTITLVHANVYLAVTVTLSLLLATLPFSMGEAENILVLHPCGTYCIPDWTSRARSSLIMTAACVVVVSIPMGVILYAYTAIYLQFAHANQILSVELNNSVPSLTKETKEARPTMDRSFREARKKERKLLIQSIAIVSVFVLGYSPYYIMILYQAISGTQVHASIDFAAAAIAQLEEFFNPVVVLLFDDAIRYRCLKLLQIKR